MIQASELYLLLEELQSETPNCGGMYAFWKVPVEYTPDVLQCVRTYCFGSEGNPEIETRLVLEEIPDFALHLKERLNYWSSHRTSLDCREDITEKYPELEQEFIRKMHAFLEQEKFISAYVVKGKDKTFSFGQDHLNDDTLIQTAGSYYILHFGWSS